MIVDVHSTDPGLNVGAAGDGRGLRGDQRAAGDPVSPPRRMGRSGERLRWGLTGLAAIFLIVTLAAARLGPTVGGTDAGDDTPGTGEPLAVLGVAPGPATRPAEK